MQRTEMIAFVTGVTVGIWGGTLSAFLACTACRAVVRNVLDQNRYIDLGPPALLRAPSAPDQNQDPLQATIAVSGTRV